MHGFQNQGLCGLLALVSYIFQFHCMDSWYFDISSSPLHLMSFNSIAWIHGLLWFTDAPFRAIWLFQFHCMDSRVQCPDRRSVPNLSIPLHGFCTIAFHVHCGNFSHLHCMDSIPLSPRLGAPCIWCGVGYLSFSLSSLIRFPLSEIGVSIVYC